MLFRSVRLRIYDVAGRLVRNLIDKEMVAGRNHTVMWNGLDLRSTTNGIADLSLMPVFLFDNISVNSGSTVNAIGGQIDLSSRPQEEDGLTTRFISQAGSFGEMKNGIAVSARRNNLSFGVKAFQQHFDNNFTYENPALPGEPLDTMEHAIFDSRGVMTEASWMSKYSAEKNDAHLLR